MSSANIDPAAILNRALEYAAQNLRVEKLLIQLGLDPANITYDVVFNRLVDIVLANINFANMLALVGATFYVATLMVRTIVPLRIIGIISIVFFIGYGALAGAVATFLLYLLSLPINVIRLRQMLNLVKKARISAQGDLSMDWLRPFMTPRKYKKGDVLFHKGDVAKEMFYTVTGKFLVKEIGIELPPGRIMGELGFIDPNNRRTGNGREPRERRGADHHLRPAARALLPESGVRLLLPPPHHRAPDAEHRASGNDRRGKQGETPGIAGGAEKLDGVVSRFRRTRMLATALA